MTLTEHQAEVTAILNRLRYGRAEDERWQSILIDLLTAMAEEINHLIDERPAPTPPPMTMTPEIAEELIRHGWAERISPDEIAGTWPDPLDRQVAAIGSILRKAGVTLPPALAEKGD